MPTIVSGRKIWMPRDAVQTSMRESSPAVRTRFASDVVKTGYSHDLSYQAEVTVSGPSTIGGLMTPGS